MEGIVSTRGEQRPVGSRPELLGTGHTKKVFSEDQEKRLQTYLKRAAEIYILAIYSNVFWPES